MFKVGDKVKAIDSLEDGEVVAVNGNQICILLDSGFEEWFPQSQLILDRGFTVGKVFQKDATASKLPDTSYQIKPNKVEVDLHFSQLVDYPKNYTSAERLSIQINAAKRGLDKARMAGIKRVIIIHGVGEGVLKENIHSLLETMDRVQFYDASFAEYGKGATEVELF